MDSSISHDPFAPDNPPESDPQPVHLGEDPQTVEALRKMAGKRLLHHYDKKVARASE